MGLAQLPRLELELDGAPAAPGLMAQLSAVDILARADAPTTCRLRWHDPDMALAASGALELERRLRVLVGAERVPLFSGAVSHSRLLLKGGEPVIEVTASDRLAALDRRYRQSSHLDMSFGDLARMFLADLGIAVVGADDGPSLPVLIQPGLSELEMLTRVGQRVGRHFHLDQETLWTFDAEGLTLPAIELRPETGLLEADIGRGTSVAGVVAQAWDTSHGEAVPEAAVGEAGATMARTLAGIPVLEAGESLARARTELGHERGKANRLIARVEGNRQLRPGLRVERPGLAPAYAGPDTLMCVRQRIDGQAGWLSELDSTPPGLPAIATTGVALAVVVAVDYSRVLGRVRVALPAHAGLETGWLQALAAGAGVDKGLVAIPDVGDRVLVVLPEGDPARGIVLGGLFGPDGPTDSGVSGGRVRRHGFGSRSGNRLILDDEAESLRLEAGNGSVLQLLPGVVRLVAKGNIELEAAGGSVTIRGRRIDFVQG